MVHARLGEAVHEPEGRDPGEARDGARDDDLRTGRRQGARHGGGPLLVRGLEERQEGQHGVEDSCDVDVGDLREVLHERRPEVVAEL